MIINDQYIDENEIAHAWFSKNYDNEELIKVILKGNEKCYSMPASKEQYDLLLHKFEAKHKKTTGVTEWSVETNIKWATIRRRIINGWSPEKALTESTGRKK